MTYQKIYMNQIHSSSLLCQLSQMWQRDILCDAVIQTGNTSTKAHRLVLVAACPMLQSMDGEAVGNKLEVKLSSEIQQEAVTEFLRYLYDGFMMLTEAIVRDVAKISRVLQVDSVTKCCADFYKVLETQIGQTAVSRDTKFSFHADQAEFRHVRASELLRSTQSGYGKRTADTSDISARKKVRGQRPLSTSQQSAGEDQFEIVQLDKGPETPRGRQLQSLAVSVASKVEPSKRTVHYIDVGNEERLSEPTRPTGSHLLPPFCPSSGNSKDWNQQTDTVSARIAKPASLCKPVASPYVSQPEPVISPFSSCCKDKVGKTVQYPHLGGREELKEEKEEMDQIVIEPMDDEASLARETFSFNSGNTGLYSVSCRGDQEKQSSGNKEENRSEQLASTSFQDGAVSLEANTADLSLLKEEKPEDDESLSYTIMSAAPGEDYGTGEEDGSDTEISFHGDTGQTTSGADDVSSSWYKQTFKDAHRLEASASGAATQDNILRDSATQYLSRLQQPVVASAPLSSLVYNKPAFCPGLSLKQKVIRAIAHFKSPIVYLRPLQRKVRDIKIDELKDFLSEKDEDPEFENYSMADLDQALLRFYRTVVIPLRKLQQFPTQLSRYLNAAPHFKNINIYQDDAFEESNKVIKQICWSSLADDYRRKKPMTQEDLNKLYESGVLSNDNPISLQNKVWVELMIYIGGLGRQDLRSLEKDNFIFEKDENDKLYFRLDAYCVTPAKKQIRVYEQPDNMNCPVQSLWLYLSKLNPKAPVFFAQPLSKHVGADDAVWYSHRPIGKNSHSSWLANICKEAGVTTEYRNQALYCRTTPVKIELKPSVIVPRK